MEDVIKATIVFALSATIYTGYLKHKKLKEYAKYRAVRRKKHDTINIGSKLDF